jgi:integrase
MTDNHRKKTRRNRGEGGLTLDKKRGLYRASYIVSRDENGKTKRKYVSAMHKADALVKLDDLRADLRQGHVLRNDRITVGQYLRDWLETTIKPNLTAGTHRDYESVIRNHVLPKIGGIKLTGLLPDHIQRLSAELANAGQSPRNREKVHIILSGALAQAVTAKKLSYNPSRAVKPPKVDRAEMLVWDHKQARQFLRAAKGDPLYAMYVLALTTGMRQGELLGLKWADLALNASRPTLNVWRTLDPHPGELRLKDLKTKWSRRQIVLSAFAVRALKKHRRQQMEDGQRTSELVFPNSEGNPLFRGNVVRRSFWPLMTKAGLKRIRFHDLRHTAATLLLLKGVGIKIVQVMLGHKDATITLNTYSHVLPNMLEQAAAASDRLFGLDYGT